MQKKERQLSSTGKSSTTTTDNSGRSFIIMMISTRTQQTSIEYPDGNVPVKRLYNAESACFQNDSSRNKTTLTYITLHVATETREDGKTASYNL